jgi:hypothetical protein
MRWQEQPMTNRGLGFACCPPRGRADAPGFDSPPFLAQGVGGNATGCQLCRLRPPPATCGP